MKRSTFLIALASLASAPAWADPSYPNKPIRIIVPFTPGGSPDVLARTIGQKISESTGAPVVIENVAGAGGTVGADRASKAAPDGYTLLMGHVGTLAVAPAVYPNLPYDPIKSFVPVAWVAKVPNVLAVHPSMPVNNVTELVKYLKANPGKVNYGSGGNGSAAHLAMEYFKLSTQTFVVHVPYRGTAPSVTDAIAGQIQMVFTGAPALVPMVKAGKLRAIAVSSPKRLDLLPDVPTLAESGVKGLEGFEADQWYGLVAPAGTPAAVVQKLTADVARAMQDPELMAAYAKIGIQPRAMNAENFAAYVREEMKKYQVIAREARIAAQ